MSQRAVCTCIECGQNNRVDLARLDAGPTCGKCKSPLQGAPVKVDDDALDWLTRNSPVPVVVDFYADWCGPCRMLAPHLEQLGAAHKGELIVAKVDTQHHHRTAQELGVQGIPAMFLYKGGAVASNAVGFRPIAELKAWVRPFLE